MSECMPDRMPGRMSEYLSDRMTVLLAGFVPDRMSEYMLDKMHYNAR